MKRNKLQQELIDVLKANKYPKGVGSLSRNGKFCCLGVMCEVLGLEAEEGPMGFCKYEEEKDYAPEQVVSAFGLYSHAGMGWRTDFNLTFLNDTATDWAPVIEALESDDYWKETE